MTQSQKDLILENINITLTNEKANMLVYLPAWKAPEITNDFFVMPNIKAGRKEIKFVEHFENVLKPYTGCGFNPSRPTPWLTKEVFTTKISGDLEWCWIDFEDIVDMEIYNNPVWTNPDGTMLSAIVSDLYKKAIIADTLRLAYFGDKNNGAANFNLVDGVWAVIYPRGVANGTIKRVTLPTTNLVSGQALQYIKEVYDLQSDYLDDVEDSAKVFNVSRSVYNALKDDLANLSGNFTLDFILENKKITYQGIEVVKRKDWDRNAAIAGLTSKHFIELTTRYNKIIATSAMSVENKFEMGYDYKEETIWTKCRPDFGFDIFSDDLVVVGY